MSSPLLQAVPCLALATAVISVTISKAEVFAAARAWLASKSAWLGKLVKCPYCTSHWVSLGLVAVYQPRLVRSACMPLDLVVSAFVLVALAMPAAYVIIVMVGSMDDQKAALVSALRQARDRLAEYQRKEADSE